MMVVLTISCLVFLAMATDEITSGELIESRYRSHGDVCGHTSNTSLVCCLGLTRSTLIYIHEVCCNGLPLRPGQMCCNEVKVVDLTSPDDDACCLDPETEVAKTFSSRTHFCNSSFSVVRRPLFIFPSMFRPRASVSPTPAPLPVCHRQPYSPATQTCCAGITHDLPAHQSQCCQDEAYRRGDSRNPCVASCGQLQYDKEHELCCQGVVHNVTGRGQHCCGREIIQSDRKECCERGHVIIDVGGPYACCNDYEVYVKRYMTCRGKRVKRKHSQQFLLNKLVNGDLPEWNATWPEPVMNDNLTRVSGTVQSADLDHSLRLTLSLVNVSMPSSATQIPACLTDGNNATLAGNISSSNSRYQETQLRRYLGKPMTVFLTLDHIQCGEDNSLILRVPASSGRSLILISR